MTGEQDDKAPVTRAEIRELARRMADHAARFEGLETAVEEMRARLAAIEARLGAAPIGGFGDGTGPARAEPGG